MIYKIVYTQNIFSNDGNPYKCANVYGNENIDSGGIAPPTGDFVVDNIQLENICDNVNGDFIILNTPPPETFNLLDNNNNNVLDNLNHQIIVEQ